MGAVWNNTTAAMHPTQYRLLPSLTAPYRPGEESGRVGTHDGTKFFQLGVRSVANSPQSTGMGFWSINPYVGCELGCTYCYAHYTHQYVAERVHDAVETSPDNRAGFTRHIFVKQRHAVLAALERDLARIQKRNSASHPHPIALGTATDPYQPAERRFGITRAILEQLAAASGLVLGITTKSPLICRDIDVLLELKRRHRMTVYVSLISSDARLIGLFETRSPPPHARLRALRKLRDAGITAGITAAPILPGVTDSAFQVDSLMGAAKQAGAAFVYPSVLRLYPSVREGFLPVIQQHFPDLLPRYRAAYGGGRSAPSGYVSAVRRRFERLARKHGIDARDPFAMDEQRQAEPKVQLSLL